MIFYVNDNHRSIWHRLSHFHPVIKFLFNLGVRFKYIKTEILNGTGITQISYVSQMVNGIKLGMIPTTRWICLERNWDRVFLKF